MAVSIGVHAASSANNPSTPHTTASVTTTAGSVLYVAVGYQAGQFSSVTDSKSNTWVQVGSELLFDSNGIGVRVYKADGGSRGTSHTFSLNTSSPTFGVIFMGEVKSADTAGSLDQNSFNEDTATPFASNSITPTIADNMLMGAMIVSSSGTTEADTWGGSFASGDKVEEQTNANDLTGSFAMKVLNSTSAQSFSNTISGVTVTSTGLAIWNVKGVAASTGLMGQACL